MRDAVLTHSLKMDHEGRVGILQVASSGITPVSEKVQQAHAFALRRIACIPPDVFVVPEPVYAWLVCNEGCTRDCDIGYGDRVQVLGAFAWGSLWGLTGVVTLRLVLPDLVARDGSGVAWKHREAMGSSGPGMVAWAVMPGGAIAEIASGTGASGEGARVSLV